MIAIEISSFGGPQVLRPAERVVPTPGASEVLIRVVAAGVSRADIMQRQGRYPPPPGAPDIPGLDIAGTIESVGSDVHDWKAGDRVCAIVTGGGYAEFCLAPAVQVLPVPENWSEIEAATLPENAFTVYDNLITRGALQAGETALIHGGTSGIGSTAIMLAKAWNARVIATAGSAPKCEACLQLGADHAINYREEDFVARISEFTNGRGADVILDLVGGAYLDRNLEALATEGRLAIVATQGGRAAELNLGRLMQKRASVMGSTMRARSPEQKGQVAERLRKNLWPLLPDKKFIKPVIDATFSLVEARLAHERMESGKHIGKILLVTSGPGLA